MPSDSSLRRIGVVDATTAAWSAGATYTRMILQSLSPFCEEAEIELCLLSNGETAALPKNVAPPRVIPLDGPVDLPIERAVRRTLRLARKSQDFRGEQRIRRLLRHDKLYDIASRENISILLPLREMPPGGGGVRTLGWIPDFQHLYLPEYFSQLDIDWRNEVFLELAQKSTLVLLSSEAAFRDYKNAFGAWADKGRVVPFPSLFAFEGPESGDVAACRAVTDKYNIPEKFALVANQFWKHKNHMVVVEALARLKSSGIHIPVVMTGLSNGLSGQRQSDGFSTAASHSRSGPD